MGAFDKQIPFKLRDGVEDLHGHRAGGTCEIGTTQGETVDLHAHFRERLDGGADIDGVTTEPIKLGDNENVAGFQPVHEFGKATALRDCRAAGNCLADDPARLDLKAGGLNFLNLVFGGLAGRGDADIGAPWAFLQ